MAEPNVESLGLPKGTEGTTRNDDCTTSLLQAPPSAEDKIGDEDLATLRRVPDSLPISIWLVTIIEMCERFAYFGLSAPLQNYIQNPKGIAFRPGGLGLGQAYATALKSLFALWCYITPIVGAIAADQYLGRYNTITCASIFYTSGLFLLVWTSSPIATGLGASVIGLLVSMLLIGIGTGGIKANVNPLVAEQYTGFKATLRTLKSGERLIIDHDMTIERIFMTFYMCVNVGSLSPAITTYIESRVGFWAAFLLPALVFLFGFVVLVAGKKNYTVNPPKGSVISDACKVLWMALKHRGNLKTARPSYQSMQPSPLSTPWDEHFIDEIGRTLAACKVFIVFPFYWVAFGQMLTNFISQTGSMETHGIPNDVLINIDPLAIILFVPFLDRLVYPFLRKIGISFRPIAKITWGFLLCSLAMAYAAFVQQLIYSAPPCYRFPLANDCHDGKVPNKVHVAVQIPAYLLIALSEIFTAVTGLEYAFKNAPPSMRSLVMAISLSTVAVGSGLAIAITPLTVNPRLVWMYALLSLESFVAGVLFYWIFKDQEQSASRLGKNVAGSARATDSAHLE